MTATAISYLFVPASRPDRYVKALQSGAHNVIIDLEDAVAFDDKDSALANLFDALEKGLPRPVYVRINASDSQWFERDISALAKLPQVARASLAGVLVAKVESVSDIEQVAAALKDVEIIVLIESAAGVSLLRQLAQAPGTSRLALGAADLSFDLDVEIASSTIDYVYAQLVLESRLAGLPGPIASPPFSLTELGAIAVDAKRLRALGAVGQLAIHPTQLDPIHRGFRPSLEQVEWASKVVAAADGASRVDGQMVDKPVQDRAARILAQAE